MNNVRTFDNLYANLAQNTYDDRPMAFHGRVPKDGAVKIDYSQDITETYGKNTDTIFGSKTVNPSKLYLQADEQKEEIIKNTNEFTVAGGKQRYEEREILVNKRSLMSDESEGFNAYYLSDTPIINHQTKNTYFTVRGSDGFSFEPQNVQIPLNDWLKNNADFVMNNSYIKQAHLANTAMKVKLSELHDRAPNAKMNVTGHSLGTMISVQSLANLSIEELQQIGEVHLFNGPDVLDSLKKMGVSDEKVAILDSKITYYVNPFDMVAMLNRNKDVEEQLGKVQYIVPLNYKSTLDDGIAHDFGEFQMNSNGVILTASEDFHPELLEAGKDLSSLLDKYVNRIKEQGGIPGTLALELSKYLVNEKTLIPIEFQYILDEFKKEYQAIVENAKEKSIAWNKKHIPVWQNEIQYATGAEKIRLRSYLLLSAGQLAMLETEDRIRGTKKRITAYKNHVYGLIVQAHQQAHRMAYYLNSHEVQPLLANFQLPNFWDDSLENMSMKQLDEYKVKIDQFSTTLFKAVEQLEELDASRGQTFESVLGNVKERWGR